MSPSIISRHALLLQPTLRLAQSQSQSQSLRHSIVAAYRTGTRTGTGTGLTTTRSISISCLAKQRHHSSSVKLPSSLSLSLSLSLSPHHHPHPAYRLFSSSSNGARVKEVKNELLDSIERDVHELSADEEQSATVQEYVTENGWTLEEDQVNNNFTLKKKINNSDVVVKFDANPDDVTEVDDRTNTAAGAEVDDGDEDNIQQQQQQQADEDDEQHTVQPHTIYIDIHTPNKQYVRIYAYADTAGQLNIDKLNFDEESVAEAENNDDEDSTTGIQERNELNYADLLEEVQESFQRYLEELGLDDRLALFVQEFTFQKRTEQHVEKLKKLASIVNALA